MNGTTQDQARFLFETMNLLRQQLMPRQCTATFTDENGKVVALTMAQLNALSAIRSRDLVTIKELAGVLQVSAPSASTMVDRLVEMGILSREHSRTDRREVEVRVTGKGIEAMSRMEDSILVSLGEIMEKMGPQWVDSWCDVYKRVREVLEDEQNPFLRTHDLAQRDSC